MDRSKRFGKMTGIFEKIFGWLLGFSQKRFGKTTGFLLKRFGWLLNMC